MTRTKILMKTSKLVDIFFVTMMLASSFIMYKYYNAFILTLITLNTIFQISMLIYGIYCNAHNPKVLEVDGVKHTFFILPIIWLLIGISIIVFSLRGAL